jgi:hypothetical protein
MTMFRFRRTAVRINKGMAIFALTMASATLRKKSNKLFYPLSFFMEGNGSHGRTIKVEPKVNVLRPR